MTQDSHGNFIVPGNGNIDIIIEVSNEPNKVVTLLTKISQWLDSQVQAVVLASMGAEYDIVNWYEVQEGDSDLG